MRKEQTLIYFEFNLATRRLLGVINVCDNSKSQRSVNVPRFGGLSLIYYVFTVVPQSTEYYRQSTFSMNALYRYRDKTYRDGLMG